MIYIIVFRESCILVDPENTSSSSRQWIAIVVTHEMAHQWFGNLVTMEWWTHLWLNEGQFTVHNFIMSNVHMYNVFDSAKYIFIVNYFIKHLKIGIK